MYPHKERSSQERECCQYYRNPDQMFFKGFSGNCLTLHLQPGNCPFKRMQCPLLLGTLAQEEAGQDVCSRNYFLGIFQGKENTTVEWGVFLLDQMFGVVWETELYGEFWTVKMPLETRVSLHRKKWEVFIPQGNEQSMDILVRNVFAQVREIQYGSHLWRNYTFSYSNLLSMTIIKYLRLVTYKDRRVFSP